MAKKRHMALGGDEEMGPVAEINITPMVDVMLVLLIIFMVTAPLMMSQLPVTLPKAAPATPDVKPKDPLIVSVNIAGQYFIDQDRAIGPVEIAADQLQPKLIELAKQDPDGLVYVSGDQKINYGRVVDLIGIVGNSGFAKVSLQSKQAYADGSPASR